MVFGLFVPRHLFRPRFGRVVSQERHSCHFVRAVSFCNRSRICLRNIRGVRHTRPVRTQCRRRRLVPAVVFQCLSTASPRHFRTRCWKILRWLVILAAAQHRLDVHVSAWWFCSHSVQQLPALDWRIPLSFDVSRIVFNSGCDPRSALLGVWLSDHQARFAARCRSELRHHLLRGVDASAVFFDLGLKSIRSPNAASC